MQANAENSVLLELFFLVHELTEWKNIVNRHCLFCNYITAAENSVQNANTLKTDYSVPNYALVTASVPKFIFKKKLRFIMGQGCTNSPESDNIITNSSHQDAEIDITMEEIISEVDLEEECQTLQVEESNSKQIDINDYDSPSTSKKL
ncbi:hypothetical protein AVEN_131984-1 [Araneus ventricosus]|uniref:Uncharacterized protein n=1 Tax=Araneus ventricosus TaxID=182803 RepID=A0A4Y2B5B9_ARAVE|nr:hypothetical protein AVEN_131984-1 [Araneus ventricosus]